MTVRADDSKQVAMRLLDDNTNYLPNIVSNLTYHTCMVDETSLLVKGSGLLYLLNN